MSMYAERRWELEQERKRTIYLDQIRSRTREYLQRNQERLDAIVAQGLDIYIPNEFSRCRNAAASVLRALSRDPEHARDQNIELSRSLSGLHSRARTARSVAQMSEQAERRQAEAVEREYAIEVRQRAKDERTERQRAVEQAQATLLEIVRVARKSLKDPVEQDFALDRLKEIERALSAQVIEPEALAVETGRLNASIAAVRNDAVQQAIAWKNQVALDESQEAAAMIFQDYLDNCRSIQDPLAETAIRDIYGRLLAGGIDEGTFFHSLEDVQREADVRAASEATRREAVGAIVNSLKQAGYSVGPPRQGSDGSGDVIVHAKKPSGGEAAFKIAAGGVLSYKFDKFEGSSCMVDIDRVLPTLHDIYGIELGDETVHWRNPDRIHSDALPLPNSVQGKANGN